MIYSLIIKHILLNRLISGQLVQITLVNHINHILRHYCHRQVQSIINSVMSRPLHSSLI